MKKLGLIFLLTSAIAGVFFFNAWYMQQIYEVGLIPIMNLFNVELPLISYKAFIVIVFFSSCVITAFKYDNKKKEKIPYGTTEFNEGITKFFVDIFGMILTKLLNVLILMWLIKIIL